MVTPSPNYGTVRLHNDDDDDDDDDEHFVENAGVSSRPGSQFPERVSTEGDGPTYLYFSLCFRYSASTEKTLDT